MTNHRIPDGFGYDEPKTGTTLTGDLCFGLRVTQVHDDRPRSGSAPAFDRPTEIGRGGEPMLFR